MRNLLAKTSRNDPHNHMDIYGSLSTSLLLTSDYLFTQRTATESLRKMCILVAETRGRECIVKCSRLTTTVCMCRYLCTCCWASTSINHSWNSPPLRSQKSSFHYNIVVSSSTIQLNAITIAYPKRRHSPFMSTIGDCQSSIPQRNLFWCSLRVSTLSEHKEDS